MELLWIPIAMTAGLMQAVRTAGQKALNAHLSTWATTYVRSLFGLPLMMVYLWVVHGIEGRAAPDLHVLYLASCAAAATSQVGGTYLLIVLFRLSNFAVGTMLTKTDVMQAAIIGTLFFSEAISPVGWVAIVMTVVGVVLLTARDPRRLIEQETRGSGAAVLTGLASAFLFCLSYLFLREASLILGEGSTIWRGAWSVVVVTSMQVAVLGLWLLSRRTERAEIAKLPGLIRPALFIGVTSAIGSVGWFTAMAMENASYVKAVGQVEVIFTVLISTFYFRERITGPQYAGIATIVAAVILFIL